MVGHAPADDRDLAKWAGLPLRDARAGLAAIASQLHQRDDGLLELAGQSGRVAPLPAPRLLGAFDPLLLGWCSRTQFLAGNQSIVTVNGLFRPFALVRGRAAATWSLTGGKVVLKPLAPLAPSDERALLADAADVVRYLSPSSMPSGVT